LPSLLHTIGHNAHSAVTARNKPVSVTSQVGFHAKERAWFAVIGIALALLFHQPDMQARERMATKDDSKRAQQRPAGDHGKSGGHTKVNPIQMQKYLKGAHYPASKDDLVHLAQGNHAPDDVMEIIRTLPGDQFASTKDVTKALGTMVAIPVLLASSGYVLTGTFDWAASLWKKPWQNKGFYLILTVALLASLALALLRLNPIQLMFWS
jgi:hypothetical protein